MGNIYNRLMSISLLIILSLLISSHSSQQILEKNIQAENNNPKNEVNTELNATNTGDNDYSVNRIHWGTYKPHLISAFTQKIPNPITIGIMHTPCFERILPPMYMFNTLARHKITNLVKNYYLYHNGIDFSLQRIIDRKLNMQSDITIIKKDELVGGLYNHRWIYYIQTSNKIIDMKSKLKIVGSEDNDEKNDYDDIFNISLKDNDIMTNESLETNDSYSHKPTVAYSTNIDDLDINEQENWKQANEKYIQYVYITLEEFEPLLADNAYIRIIKVNYHDDNDNGGYSFLIEIHDPELNLTKGFIHIEVSDSKKRIESMDYCLIEAPRMYNWMVSSNIYGYLIINQTSGLMNFDPNECHLNQATKSTAFFMQIIGQPGFTISISYDPIKPPELINHLEFINLRQNKILEFQRKFNQTLRVKNTGFLDSKKLSHLSRYALSNLLGGISYSYGRVKIEPFYIPYKKLIFQNSKELLTATPCRSNFPRGFLWDEGFHQLVICKWDLELCIEMINSWFNTMDERGWIPREQARGIELEDSFKQKEYVYQDIDEANPPTFIMSINYLSKLLNEYKNQSHEHESTLSSDLNKDLAIKVQGFLSNIRPKLHKWYRFYNISQLNTDRALIDQLQGRIFRWRCKHPCNWNFYMGSGLDDYPRHENYEISIGHLDLQSWMVFLVKSLIELDQMLGIIDNSNSEIIDEYDLIIKGFDEFYEPNRGHYSDITADTRFNLSRSFSSHIGYVNLFPLFFGILDKSRQELAFNSIIAMMNKAQFLYSPYGIRSLASDDIFFRQGAQYWTEPIWLNINYLILKGLYEHYKDIEDITGHYNHLRENLIKLIWQNYVFSGTIWENYSSISGKGQGFSGFNGWSGASTILILAELY